MRMASPCLFSEERVAGYTFQREAMGNRGRIVGKTVSLGHAILTTHSGYLREEREGFSPGIELGATGFSTGGTDQLSQPGPMSWGGVYIWYVFLVK